MVSLAISFVLSLLHSGATGVTEIAKPLPLSLSIPDWASHPLLLLGGAILAAVIPIAVGTCTSFLKVSLVLGILRNALGTTQAPGGAIVLALSAVITYQVMAPVIDETIERADRSDLSNISAIAALLPPWRNFMLRHTSERELYALSELSNREGGGKVYGPEMPRPFIIIGAFVLSELREGFTIAFILLLPFAVIDLVVANILTGLGMVMVTPALIALPLKLLAFILSDGWILLTSALIRSYE